MLTAIRHALLFALLPAVALAAPPDVKIGYAPKGEAKKRVESLAQTIQSRGLSAKHLVDADNARPFLYLAATHDDPKVVGEALGAMARTWSRKGKGKRPKVDADFLAVVKKRLQAKNGKVLAGALKAARLPLGGQVDAAVLDQVMALARTGKPAARVAAQQALFNVKAFQTAKATKGDTKKKVVKTLLASLDAKEAPVVAAALHQLSRAAYPGMPEVAALQKKAQALMAHADPGVQGEAMLLAARAAGAKDAAALGPMFQKALGSEHAFVRAAAAEAAGQTKYTKAIPALVKLLDDGAKNGHAVKGFKALDGTKGEVRLRATGKRVDESALAALALMTKGSKKAFDPGSLSGRDRAKKRTEAIAKAKKHFAAK